ncbi:MAG: DUF4421 family protein [Luteibaculaceae bacterium]
MSLFLTTKNTLLTRAQFALAVLFMLCFQLSYFPSSGQGNRIGIFQKPELDSLYIKSYYEDLVVRPNFNQRDNSFQIFDLQKSNNAEFNPNAAFGVGLGFTYKWVGVGFSFNIPFTDKDRDRYGTTTNLDLQAFIFPRKYFGMINMQYYEGYYLSNHRDILPNLPDNANLGRPDILTVNLSGSFYYIFNNSEFSFRSIFTQNEQQIKSAGSFVAGTIFSYYYLTADSTIIPQSAANLFNERALINGAEIFTISLQGGYAYSFVFGKNKEFSLSAMLVPGVGLTSTTRKFDVSSDRVSYQPTLTLNSALALNKNWGQNAIGFYIINENHNFLQESSLAFSYTKTLARLFYARRIGPPKQLTKIIK